MESCDMEPAESDSLPGCDIKNEIMLTHTNALATDNIIQNEEKSLKDILAKIENLCNTLLPEDHQYILMTTSTGKKTFDICGSENAISFMDKYKTMAQDFVLHCYSAVSEEKDTPESITEIKAEGNSKISLDDADHDEEEEASCDVNDEIDVEKSIEKIVKMLVTKQNMSIDNVLKELVKLNDSLDGCFDNTSAAKFIAARDITPERQNVENIESREITVKNEFEDENDFEEMADEDDFEDTVDDIGDEDYVESDESKECEPTASKRKTRRMKSDKSIFEFKCDKCGHHFATEKFLQNHLEEHLVFDKMDDKNTECSICQKTFCDKPSLRRHYRTHSNCQLYECQICSKSFSRSDTYKNHLRIHKEPEFKCTKCNRHYHTKQSLTKHGYTCDESSTENTEKQEDSKDQNFTCTNCNRHFNTKQLLTKHAENCNESSTKNTEDQEDSKTSVKKKRVRLSLSGEWQCLKCNLRFTSELFLQNHLDEHKIFDNMNTEEKQCPECSKTFSDIKNLKRHYRTHSKCQLYECPFCSKTFNRSDTYKNHLNCHGDPKFSCSQCNRQYHTQSALNKHARKCGSSPFSECKECKIMFSNRENYEMHVCNSDDPANFIKTYKSEQTEDGKHFCGICNKVFNKRKGLLRHRKLHSEVLYRDNACEICKKNYKSKQILQKHIKAVHSETRDYVCDLCGKSFSRSDGLKQHLKTHSTDDSVKVECSLCGKLLSSRTALSVHMRIHQDAEPYICEVCGKSFRQQSNLRSHKLVHTDEANYNCDKCPKKLKSLALWKTHMRAHAVKEGLNDETILAKFGKFYTCELCQKKVATATQYKQHMRSHSNERPYCCDICSKYFKERSKLKRHLHNVHSERMYETNMVSLQPVCFNNYQ
ncbi:zinc finger protein 493-like [Mytilus edulis]|uniref:zinc finger protein 493-like n=1 Tax=Mytilus edulis TaxID=6550 RepID=UPI0039EFDE61